MSSFRANNRYLIYMRTIAEINQKISRGQAVVWTVAEVKAKSQLGISKIFEQVDVVTTGTFEPMESTGAIINLGHTDPPIKIRQCWLDGIAAYAAFGAVDLYLGATATADYNLQESDPNLREGVGGEKGGGHVIEDLIAGRAVQLKAIGQKTDCYPRAMWENAITKDNINQFYLFNPRNLYQNFIVGVNGAIALYILI